MRFWLAVAVILAIVCVAQVQAADAPPAATQVAVVNNSQISDTTLSVYLPYFQTAADQMCSRWGCHLALSLQAPSPGEWTVELDPSSTIPGALGYHEEWGGTPKAFVAVSDSIKAGFPWGVVLTHELFEMAVDPEASAADQTGCAVTDPGTGAQTDCTFFSREVADPVESYWYRLGPVRVSDFVLPAWFEKDASGPYDALRHLSQPLSLGYHAYLTEYTGGAWTSQDTFTAHRNWDRP